MTRTPSHVIVKSTLAQDAATGNQQAVDHLFDQTSGSASGEIANAITQLTTLSPEQFFYPMR